MFAIGDKEWPGISKLNEESGEVVQVIGKLMQSRGDTKHWSGDLKIMLHEEMGDVLAAIEFVLMHNDQLDSKAVYERKAFKLSKFIEWHLSGDTKP